MNIYSKGDVLKGTQLRLQICFILNKELDSQMIKVFLVDDHIVVIEGINALLQNEPAVEVAGYATNAAQCLQYFSSKTADVILMDISMPGMDGIELCKIIKEKYPGVMVLALSTFDQGAYVRKMIENGASGYLLKNAGKSELINAIQLVSKGKNYLSHDASQNLKLESQKQKLLPRLTKREKEVLNLIVAGFTNAQIGQQLFISPDTVDSHRKNLHLKLNVNNTASLVKFAIENNLA